MRRSPLLRRLFPRRREALPSSQITHVSTCPALRPRWCPARLPWREQDGCLPIDAHRRLWVRLPGLILLSTIIHFSGFNDAACVLASPLLRTVLLSTRSSVRLPTRWLTFGRVGLDGFRYLTHWVTLTCFKRCLLYSHAPDLSRREQALCWTLPFSSLDIEMCPMDGNLVNQHRRKKKPTECRQPNLLATCR